SDLALCTLIVKENQGGKCCRYTQQKISRSVGEDSSPLGSSLLSERCKRRKLRSRRGGGSEPGNMWARSKSINNTTGESVVIWTRMLVKFKSGGAIPSLGIPPMAWGTLGTAVSRTCPVGLPCSHSQRLIHPSASRVINVP